LNINFQDTVGEKVAIFRRPEVARPFGIIILLSIVQQFSGMTILRAYVVKIFNNIFAHTPAINGNNQVLLILASGHPSGSLYPRMK